MLIDSVIWHTMLDERVCTICQPLEGFKWKKVEGGGIGAPVGHSRTFPGSPPLHPHCRCTLGIDSPTLVGGDDMKPDDVLDADPDFDMPGQGKQESTGQFLERMRRQMRADGLTPEATEERIREMIKRLGGAATETKPFLDWLNDQTPAAQDRTLGPSKGRMFRQGLISVRDLSNQSHRPLTVEDLERTTFARKFRSRETEGAKLGEQVFSKQRLDEMRRFIDPGLAVSAQESSIERLIQGADPSNLSQRNVLLSGLMIQAVTRRITKSPAEILGRALGAAEVFGARDGVARLLRSARDKTIGGLALTSREAAAVKALSAVERKNFILWTEGAPAGGISRAGRIGQAGIDADFPAANPVGRDTFDRHKVGQGFTPQREKLHTTIIDDALKGATPVEKPVALMTGGGPASGKSVLAREGHVPSLKNAVIIDSDEIKKLLPEYKLGTKLGDPNAAAFAHEESSFLSKKILNRAAETNRNIVLDGTGDSSFESLKRKTDALRAGGQTLKANYVTVDTAEAIRRNEARALRTGRMVPNSFVSETHKNISAIFPRALKENLFDEVTLWDTNTPGKTIKVVSQKGGVIVIHDETLWQRFLDKANE